jgi:phytanoyl-CoA hydroxylase
MISTQNYLSQNDIEKFKNDGFVCGPKILEDYEIEELINEVERVIEEKDHTDIPQPKRVYNLTQEENNPVIQIVNIWQGSKAFDRLISNVELAKTASELLNHDEIKIWHDQIQYKPSSTGGTTAWHQDSPLWRAMKSYEQVSAWIALDDADIDNGCMSMVPGSHKWGNQMEYLREHSETIDTLPMKFAEKDISRVYTPVKKGHVHFHHALTWHGSHDNTSGRHRRAIAIHYMRGDELYDAKQGHLVTQNDTNLTDNERFIGPGFKVLYKKE